MQGPENNRESSSVSFFHNGVYVVWGIASLLSKEQGLKVQVSAVYCVSVIRYAQEAKGLVSRGDAMLLRSLGYR